MPIKSIILRISLLIYMMLSCLAFKSLRIARPRLFLTSFLSTVQNAKYSDQHLKPAHLTRIRELMAKDNIQALLVPTDDPHMSEYTAICFNRREYVSGFTGSAGTVVITQETAALFTDGRYYSQAEKELSSAWELMRVGLPGVPSTVEYLTKVLSSGSTVGVDAAVHSADNYRALERELNKKNITLKQLSRNPVDEVWGRNRPSLPTGPVREHPIEYSGKTITEKLTEIRMKMNENSASFLIITMLDEIAWLFNIRGCDVPCNPVALSYAIVTTEEAYLFMDASKVPGSLARVLSSVGVLLLPYDSVLPTLQLLLALPAGTAYLEGTHPSTSSAAAMSKVWVDGKTANQAVFSMIPESRRLVQASPIALLKACKNPAELAGMRACHLRDGAAIVEFLAWLDAHFLGSAEQKALDLDEVSLADKLLSFRAQQAGFLEPSFDTIAGVNENGAIIHYRAKAGQCKTLTQGDLLLLDSGGQYTDGTTDVTRTLHMGQPTLHQREMFTRVLKGHIALDSQAFPQGTPGCLLDALARQHLWQVGRNYAHGTGHGVGAALNVHEGPQRISPLLSATQPLCAGMILSNEPGYYETGIFGIRIENLLEVVALQDRPGFLGFRRLTQVPLQTKLLLVELLTESEIEWINTYHSEVCERLTPLLSSDSAREWLRHNTAPILCSTKNP